jgi:hypothetical protein
VRAANIRSSVIRRIAHDEEHNELCIWFRNSGKYIYEGVPRVVYDALRTAPSPGACFNALVKGRYPCSFDPERRRFRPVLQD